MKFSLRFRSSNLLQSGRIPGEEEEDGHQVTDFINRRFGPKRFLTKTSPEYNIQNFLDIKGAKKL
jgi:hypothetical protein